MNGPLIFTNGRIVTMLDTGTSPQSVAVWNGKIVSMGTHDAVLSGLPQGTDVVDLKGACLIPGLTDSHIHLMAYGLSLGEIDVGVSSRQEAIERVRQATLSRTGDDWIIGGGWDKNVWSQQPDRYCLDSFTSGVPVMLFSKDHHALWVNTEILRKCNIDRSTSASPGGVIDKDDSGEPTGILLENAMSLVLEKLPAPDREYCMQAVMDAQERLHELGIVKVHNCEGLDSLAVLAGLAADNKLTLSVTAHIPPAGIEHLGALGLGSGAGYDKVRIGGVKVFADGALGSQTADMLEPYDGSDSVGVEVAGTGELLAIAQQARQAGLTLAIHAIGDRAVRRALDVLEQVPAPPGQRPRIEHAQLVDPDDVKRFVRLGVVASMQPIHAPSDRDTADRYWGERCRTAYAWRTLLDAGVDLAFGSDAPVESPDPMRGLIAGVLRSNDERPSWYPEQSLTVMETLWAYTRGAASATGRPLSGCIVPGEDAYLTVLSPDPFSISADELTAVQPVMTVAAGEIVWARREW